MKIGILGGTFNPPHNGHLRLAESVAEELKLDKVLIIPSCVPPHKIAGSPVNSEIRLQMCRLMFDKPIFQVSDIEIKREGKSYTVDTLRQLKSENPDDEFYFMMGSDMLSTFNQWYKWEEILTLATICGVSRKNGYKPDLSGYTEEQKRKIIYLDIEPVELSSTEIRSAIKNNEDTSAFICPALAEFIKAKGLYDDGFDKYRSVMLRLLDDRRFYHSECVSESAAELAKLYGADVEKAKLAGLLHDITKQLPAEEQLSLLGEITPLERNNYKVWHQMTGPIYLKKEGLCDDEEILEAIRWHTTGKEGMTLLSKIVYVADFISADRDYADVEVVRRLALTSLEHAILYTGRYTVNSLVKQDKPVHPATMDCYNDMLRHFGL